MSNNDESDNTHTPGTYQATTQEEIYSSLNLNESAFHEYFLDTPCELRPSGQRLACCFPMTKALAKSMQAYRDPETNVKVRAYIDRLENLKKRVYGKKMQMAS